MFCWLGNVDTKKEVGRSGALSASPHAAGAGPGENQTTAIIDVNPPRGTRDFPPDDMRLRTWLFHNFREVSQPSTLSSNYSAAPPHPHLLLLFVCLFRQWPLHFLFERVCFGFCLSKVARLFAFEEVDFPVLESEALFIRKAGEEITEQVLFLLLLLFLFLLELGEHFY